jgi:hypothetical protein
MVVLDITGEREILVVEAESTVDTLDRGLGIAVAGELGQHDLERLADDVDEDVEAATVGHAEDGGVNAVL